MRRPQDTGVSAASFSSSGRRLEDEVARAVCPGTLEREDDTTVVEESQPVRRHPRRFV
jgi:hypothetical protein